MQAKSFHVLDNFSRAQRKDAPFHFLVHRYNSAVWTARPTGLKGPRPRRKVPLYPGFLIQLICLLGSSQLGNGWIAIPANCGLCFICMLSPEDWCSNPILPIS
jgi:hypothetical protein